MRSGSSQAALDAPVVIAGGGPVGLVLALELSHQGVRSILVERRPTTTTFPDAASARVYERRLVLVRPDGHVAWRGDDAPDDCEALIAHVTGQGDRLATALPTAKETTA